MKRCLSFAMACMAISSNDLRADPVFNPAKTIIIKADDYRGNLNNQQQAWTDFVTSSRNLGVKASLGVVATSISGNTAAVQWMQQQQTLGDVEFWNHGWDHSQWTTGGTTYYEFKGSGLAFQQTHFADTQAALLSATGRDSIAFGAPYNQTDADTMTVMNNTPAVRLFFTYNGTTARSQGLVTRVQTMGVIPEAATGKPVASTFISTYPNGPAGPVSLQFHPAVFTAADLTEYEQTIQFLLGKGYIFMLPAEYIAALDGGAPSGARIWTGATDSNWTVSNNWSSGGAPASGGDVAFDGTGANPGTNLNGIARSLNSLTFTAGQSAQVTITTTNAAPLTLAPTGATGTWTTLNVAAGSHRFTGTDGGSAAAADFRFGGANGTTHVLNIGGTAVFEIKGRIDNGGSTANTKTFQKTGTGTLVLSGNSGGSVAWNHSSGSGFQIQQGALRFAALNAGGLSSNNYIVSSGAAFELDGNFNQTINNGTYTLNGTGIGGTGTLRSLSGTKSITGSGTGGVNLASHASIGVDEGNLTIAQVVKGPGSLTKVGPGTLTLNGGNTYTGATIVSGGTLALGASNVLPATQVSLGNAALSAGAGFTETTGRLDVTGSATINFGDNSSAIAFADNSDLLDWTGTLNITGSFVSGSSLRFGTNANGLTAAQSARITVNGEGGYTLNSLGYLGETAALTHYDVYLLAGQSNADGRGTNSELTGALASYAAPPFGVKIFYVNPTNSNPVTPSYNTGWTTLAPGYSVAPGFSGSLPSPNFGFELSLGKALAAKHPERKVAIIKVSRGGTNLHTQWDPAGGDNFMWQTFANKVPEALAALTASGDTAEIRGMFWHQGESDGSNPTYQNDLTEFIAACRTLTGKPNLPFALGELERDDVTPTVSGRGYQLTAMADVAAADPNTFLVSSAGLPTSDGTHFTSAAYVTFGERLAKAYHDFVDGVTFSVSYDGNGSTSGSIPADSSNPYSSVSTATVLGAGGLVKAGHNFAGWNTTANASGTSYPSGHVFAITESTTLYAQWTPKPAPTITSWPMAAPITEGQTLSSATLSGGSASAPGVFTYIHPSTVPPAGTYAAEAIFTPNDTVTYNTVSSTLNVTVRTLFESWAGNEEITFTGDANGDGIADGMAFLLGAETATTNARLLLPSVAENEGALQASFKMRNLSSRGAAVLKLQYGTTLGSWTTVSVPDESGTYDGIGFSINPNGQPGTVVATIPATAAPGGRLFIRLSGAEF